MSSDPFISVIIPVFNSARTLEACLQKIYSSDFTNFEIIVVDDGSSDSSIDIARKFDLRIVKHPQNLGRSAARASGFRVARGEVIVCIDSDILIDSSALSIIKEKFQYCPAVGVVSGLLSDKHPHQNIASQYVNLRLNYLYRNLPEKIPFFYGGIFAFRHELSGFFSSRFEVCEDTDIGIRLATRNTEIVLMKNLVVSHLKVLSFSEFLLSDFGMAFNWAAVFIENQVWKYFFHRDSMIRQLLRYIVPVGFLFYLIEIKKPVGVFSAIPFLIFQSLNISIAGFIGLLSWPLKKFLFTAPQTSTILNTTSEDKCLLKHELSD